jgi:hypothetical protein
MDTSVKKSDIIIEIAHLYSSGGGDFLWKEISQK